MSSTFTNSTTVDRVGNLEIKFEGHVKENGVTKYVIRVTGPHGSHVVHRRYNEFDQLHKEMQGQGVQTTEAAAAAMPPKSFWRRSFSKEFRVSREHQLEGVATSAVQAAANMDVDDCPPALRRFLGLEDAARPSLPSTRALESESAITGKEHKSLMQKAEDMIHKVEEKVEHALDTTEQTFSHHETEGAAADTLLSSSDTGHTPTEPEPEAVVKTSEDQPAMLERIETKMHDALDNVEDCVKRLDHKFEAMEGSLKEQPSKPMPALPDIYKILYLGEITKQKGIYYREEKIQADWLASKTKKLSKKLQEWDSYVVGVDEGDGFLRVDGLGYLPMMFGQVRCVKLAEAPKPEAIYTLSHDYYECTNHSSACLGMCCRKSKNIDDRSTDTDASLAWGSVVHGVDQGDDWLKVGDRFLPMKLNGSPVMIAKGLTRSAAKAKGGCSAGCFAGCCR